VLEVDSRLKELAGGFEEYTRVRAERLRVLRSGQIEVEIEHVWHAEPQCLQIRVKDNGRGFDHEAVMLDSVARKAERYGRGIAIVCDLCESVTYVGNGNEGIARYQLNCGTTGV